MEMHVRSLARAAIAVGTTLGAMLAIPGVASADPTSPNAAICSSAGTSLSGTHHNLVVRGNAYVANGATLTVKGSLTIAKGGCLDAFSLGTVHVTHDVYVQPGATLALGCAPGSNGPPPMPPCGFTTTNDTVGGSIVADRPLTMYLTAVTVGRNVISFGGGPGAQSVGTSFPVKSMQIRGDLVLVGWHGGWIGALRNTVGGSVVIAGNVGSRPGDDGTPDSTEVLGNTIGRNLYCFDNTPTARYGDAFGEGPGNGPNVVMGRALGECKDLTKPPAG